MLYLGVLMRWASVVPFLLQLHSGVQRVIQGYVNDPQATKLLAKLATAPSGCGQFTLEDGIIRHNKRIWVGTNDSLQQ